MIREYQKFEIKCDRCGTTRYRDGYYSTRHAPTKTKLPEGWRKITESTEIPWARKILELCDSCVNGMKDDDEFVHEA